MACTTNIFPSATKMCSSRGLEMHNCSFETFLVMLAEGSRDCNVGWTAGPPLWSKLKYLNNNNWIDYHEILGKHSLFPGDVSQWSPDFSSNANEMAQQLLDLVKDAQRMKPKDFCSSTTSRYNFSLFSSLQLNISFIYLYLPYVLAHKLMQTLIVPGGWILLTLAILRLFLLCYQEADIRGFEWNLKLNLVQTPPSRWTVITDVLCSTIMR